MHSGCRSAVCHCGWWKFKWPYKYFTSLMATTWFFMVSTMESLDQIIPYGRDPARCWVVLYPYSPDAISIHSSIGTKWKSLPYEIHRQAAIHCPHLLWARITYASCCIYLCMVPGPQSQNQCAAGFPQQTLTTCPGLLISLCLHVLTCESGAAMLGWMSVDMSSVSTHCLSVTAEIKLEAYVFSSVSNVLFL